MGTIPGRVLTAVIVGLAALTVGATALADLGIFRWWLALPLLAIGIPLVRTVGLPRIVLPPGAPFVMGLLAAAVVLAGTIHHGQHLLTDRDPGVYNTTAEWLAREGTLVMPAAVAPLDDPRVEVTTQGFTDRSGDDVLPQFAHGWPALLATVEGALGTRAMLLAPAFVGALALLVFGAFAALWLRAGAAVAAMAALAACLPFLYFTRDAYSEPLLMVFVFGGLWLLSSPPRPTNEGLRLTRALGAFVIAASCTVRIDAVLLLGAVFVVAAAAWRAGRRADTAAMLAAAAGPVVVAAVDLAWRSPEYLDYQREQIFLAAAAAVVIGIAAVIVPPLTTRLDTSWPQWRRAAGWAAAGGVVLVATWYVALRPELVRIGGAEHPRYIAALQQAEGVTVDGDRTYAEMAGRWLLWYLGPIVAAGTIGAAIAVRRLVSRVAPAPIGPFMAVWGLVTLVYLERPSIVADQMWATRRFLPVVIPGLILLAAWCVQLLLEGLTQRSRRPRQTMLLAGSGALVVALAFELAMSWPLLRARDQLGVLGATDQLCRSLPANSAVLVVPDGRLENVVTATLRARCGVAAANLRGRTDMRAVADELAVEARAEGLDLWVLGSSDTAVREAGGEPDHPASFVVRARNPVLADETLTHPPRRLVTEEWVFAAGPAAATLDVEAPGPLPLPGAGG